MLSVRFRCENQREKVSSDTRRLQKCSAKLDREKQDKDILKAVTSIDQNALHLLSKECIHDLMQALTAYLKVESVALFVEACKCNIQVMPLEAS